MTKTRCDWVSDDPLYIAYHDEEWGVPLFDEQRLFEFRQISMKGIGNLGDVMLSG